MSCEYCGDCVGGCDGCRESVEDIGPPAEAAPADVAAPEIDEADGIRAAFKSKGYDVGQLTIAEMGDRIAGSSSADIQDHSIEYTVNGGPLHGQEGSVCPVQVQLIAEELFEPCGCKPDEKTQEVSPNALFMTELVKGLNVIGVTTTPAVALGLWRAACEYSGRAQKKMS
jgi:hypothetical protein